MTHTRRPTATRLHGASMPTLLALAACAQCLFAQGALAQRTPPPLDCRVVEAVGNDHKAQIIAGLNDTVAGLEKEINRRKTMRIESVEDIAFDGCKVVTTARIELGRKIRRDAEGTAKVVGRVASLSLRDRLLCFEKHPKIASMNLSHTTEVARRCTNGWPTRSIPWTSAYRFRCRPRRAPFPGPEGRRDGTRARLAMSGGRMWPACPASPAWPGTPTCRMRKGRRHERGGRTVSREVPAASARRFPVWETQRKNPAFLRGFFRIWCPGEDSNLHGFTR